MLYRFDAQQLAEKNDKVLISRNGRQFLLSGIPQGDLRKLVAAHLGSGFIESDNLQVHTTKAMIDGLFFVEADQDSAANCNDNQTDKSCHIVFAAATSIQSLGSMPGLFALIAISLFIYWAGDFKISYFSIADLAATAPASHGIIAICTLLFTTAIHEMGHAAAACYYTGTVGKARVRMIWGIPAVTIDVTSSCLTNRIGKISISVAGAVFQSFAGMLILIASEHPGVRAGAGMGLILAGFNLLPLPHYDGYWIIVDIVGRRIQPRLLGAKDFIDFCYGLLLAGLLTTAFPASVNAIATQSAFALDLIKSEPWRAIFLITLSIFAFFSLVVFSFTLIRTLFSQTNFSIEMPPQLRES